MPLSNGTPPANPPVQPAVEMDNSRPGCQKSDQSVRTGTLKQTILQEIKSIIKGYLEYAKNTDF